MSIFINSTDKIYHLLLMKEMHTLGLLSDEQYFDLIKSLWEINMPKHKEDECDDADSDDLIIKGAKGIQDGIYNIKDGKLFKYKAKGGTVRTYEIVPSAEAGQGEWIPCSERLPSEGEVVLASWSCLWKGAIVLARRYEGKWEWAYEHGADYWQPTELEEYWPEAWMLLPEPYREDGEV